jgi:photosystem II stability/assembly factor-like uncharacterized protein
MMTTRITWNLFLALISLISVCQSQWQGITSGFPSAARAAKVSIVDQNVIWVTGRRSGWAAYTGFIRSTDGGSTWKIDTLHNAGVQSLFDICALDANTAYVIGYGSTSAGVGIFKTVDGGKSWTKAANAFTQTGSFPDAIYFFNPKEGLAIGDQQGGYFEIYTTADSGKTWSRVPSGIIPSPVADEGGNVGVVPYVCHTGDAFWFATLKNKFLRTTDKGLTWTAITVATAPKAGDSWCFFPAFKDLNNGLAGDGYVMKRTTNGGVTWDSVATPSRPGTDEVYYVPGTNGSYYVVSPYSGYTGSMYTKDNGKTWTVVDTISRSGVAFLSASAGWSNSPSSTQVFKYVGLPLAVQEKVTGVAREYALYQNYPNPFNPATTIDYQLPKQSFVKLKLFDVLGRETATLVDEAENAGKHSVRFEALSLPSGVYFYKIETGDFVQTRRLILLK